MTSKRELARMQKKEDDAKRALQANMFRWEYICRTEAPYPLNYLPSSEEGKHVAIMIGMLIEKGMLR